MTEQEFEEIQILQNNIAETERKIRVIDALSSSCGLGCKITGTPRGCRTTPDYFFSDKKEILRILQIERERLSKEWSKLKKQFKEL